MTTTVWVTTGPLGDRALWRWMALPDELEGEGVEVRGWGSDDDGRGRATLRVATPDPADAAARAGARLRAVFGEAVQEGLDLRTTPRPDDHPDDDDDDDDEEEPGPRSLSWVRTPLTWDAYAVGEDERLLQVHFVQAGSADGPGAAIAEVVVAEAGTVVAVTLFERELSGTYPDGGVAARLLAAVSGCLAVPRSRPLRQRRVIDGATGLAARRLEPSDPADAGRLERAARRGCPVWQP